MKIIEPSYSILKFDNIQLLELAGRVCYKSEDRITDTSHGPFIKHILGMHHESVIEHAGATVKFICDRGVSHELVRHRLASFSQESTRYCNYSKDKFGNELTFIRPCFWQDDGNELYNAWDDVMSDVEHFYFKMLSHGATPQEARSVLPNSLKTEVVMTCNFREWRHVFKVRAAKSAHPQMQQLMRPLLAEFAKRAPYLFDDITEELLDD